MDKFPQKVYCQYCKRKTNHDIVAKHDEQYSDEDFQSRGYYYIVKCAGCDTVAFVKVYGDSEMLEYDDQGRMQWYDEVTVHPEEPKQTDSMLEITRYHSEKEFYNTPSFIEKAYKEVVRAFNNKSSLLCAMGLRAIIEAICNHENVKNGPVFNEDGSKKTNSNGQEVRNGRLIGKINGLVERSLIAQKQARVLHQIRDLGNDAVHEVKKPSKIVLQRAIEVIEHIITTVFELEDITK